MFSSPDVSKQCQSFSIGASRYNFSISIMLSILEMILLDIINQISLLCMYLLAVVIGTSNFEIRLRFGSKSNLYNVFLQGEINFKARRQPGFLCCLSPPQRSYACFLLVEASL